MDATNGNVPFLFLSGVDADRMLRCDGKRPLPVKMVESLEDFYYHRTPQDIPENLFFALEGWMSFSDLMQVFDNELGLYLSADWYIAPVSYRSEGEYQRTRGEFQEVCRRGGLEASITREWTLDTPLGREFHDAEPETARTHPGIPRPPAAPPGPVRRPRTRGGVGDNPATIRGYPKVPSPEFPRCKLSSPCVGRVRVGVNYIAFMLHLESGIDLPP